MCKAWLDRFNVLLLETALQAAYMTSVGGLYEVVLVSWTGWRPG